MGEVVKLPQPDDWKNLLELFLFEKKVEGRAPRTISDYKLHTTIFFKRSSRALRSEKELKACILKYFSDDVKPVTSNFR
ncbi:MAG: hypothetical protein WBI47_00770 [Atribacterales bacterium]